MNWIWRALTAALLLGGTMLLVPAMTTDASAPFGAASTGVRSPARDANENAARDNEEKDNEDNVADNNEDNDNALDNENDNDPVPENDNASDNDNDSSGSTGNPGDPNTIPTDPNRAGMQVQNGDLTVDLWRSTDRPVVNTPFQLAVTGSGAPIERVWIWAESPGGNAGPAGDDFALTGERSHSCGGANPCSQNWTLIARNVGTYQIHARVRDTSGREVQTDWTALFSENPR